MKGSTTGCAGCVYLEINRIAWFPPWECWFPRKSRLYPRVVDVARRLSGCEAKRLAK